MINHYGQLTKGIARRVIVDVKIYCTTSHDKVVDKHVFPSLQCQGTNIVRREIVVDAREGTNGQIIAKGLYLFSLSEWLLGEGGIFALLLC